MLVAVIGGRLQGVEATYLAHKAGWEVEVIDRVSSVPASGLSEAFLQLDVTAEGVLGPALKGVDLVLPALENEGALRSLDRWTRMKGVAFAFDLSAYLISSSKLTSNRLFSHLHLATPMPWPACPFPVMAKPSLGSGSDGIRIFNQAEELKKHLDRFSGNWVLQEFIPGPSYSLEVIGSPGSYTPIQVTDLDMDKRYDCKRVSAPTDLSKERILAFEEISVSLAEAIKLKGLMDVEVILHGHELKVLEIDARLPSQTPTAVYWSTDVNLVQMLGQLFLKPFQTDQSGRRPPRGIVYEHIHVTPRQLAVAGEHVMLNAGPLHVCRDFFGADEAITNYAPGRDEWVATLIISEADRPNAMIKRNQVIKDIKRRCHIDRYVDSVPASVTGRFPA